MKVTVNYYEIDFYVHFKFIYNITVFIVVQNFIPCKIISYYFNSKVSPLLMYNISYEKQNNWALYVLYFRHISKSQKVHIRPDPQLNSETYQK